MLKNIASVLLFLSIILSNPRADAPPVIAVGSFRNVDYEARQFEHQFNHIGVLAVKGLLSAVDQKILHDF